MEGSKLQQLPEEARILKLCELWSCTPLEAMAQPAHLADWHLAIDHTRHEVAEAEAKARAARAKG